MRIEQIDRPEPGGIDADTYHRAEQGGRVAQDIPVNTQPPSHPFSSPPLTPDPHVCRRRPRLARPLTTVTA